MVAMTRTSGTEYCSVAEAARVLDVSRTTVWRWIEAGTLTAYRVGPKSIRIRRQDLEALLRPAREGKKGARIAMKERIWAKPVSDEELARRKALFARIVEKRKERNIAPLATADLVHKARKEAGIENGSAD